MIIWQSFKTFNNNLFLNHAKLKLLNQYPNYYNCLKFCRSLNQPEVTAGILVIGDEILNGQAEDENTPFLIQKLNKIGIKIGKIAILPDDVDAVAEEVAYFHRKYSVVITSGGIGSTHDDITCEAVAKAIDDKLVPNETLLKLARDYMGDSACKNSAVLKFSSIPSSAIINVDDKKQIVFPVISAKNIYMFPGIPSLLQKSFEIFEANFNLRNKPKFTDEIYLSAREISITPLLNEAVDTFRNRIKFGSYPSLSHNYYRVKITLESSEENDIKEGRKFFTSQLAEEKVVNLKKDVFKSVITDVSDLCEKNSSFSLAVSVVEQALEMYDISQLCICFNGGKDCTALLHLIYFCVKKSRPNDWSKLKTLYVRTGEPFKEAEDFVANSVKNYNLNLTILEGDLKTALVEFLDNNPSIKAVFMGTRRCDPNAQELKNFHPTDEHWPSIMRISPILDWRYKDVWNFIRKLQLPYCILYDKGYTSLGSRKTTVQNPALLISENTKIRSYKPAYMLCNGDEERNGRK